MPGIDLNADVGEGVASSADEQALIETVTSVSVSCGAHAGTAEDMARAVGAALSAGVVVGAHPSYPDRAGFGRRVVDLAAAALARSLDEQVDALDAVVCDGGGSLAYLKPHGALYHRACTDESTARLLAGVVREHGMALVVLGAGAPTSGVFSSTGVEVVGEAFADRAYRPDGSLVPRGEPGAVIEDETSVVGQALSLATAGRAPLAGGGWVEVRASSLCLHGDTPAAARLALAVRRALEEAGVVLAPFAR